ncbi:hypothetical protein RQP53_21085 [Paucibacter sp. APW11]|uniref:Uncharacterized protein n=1 Tax=Roseateles aquae TaxID=3077235 RepID=A0ABU3PGS8_9BURK|nr:hypothetical protein [Paucibacter sp. APW11]MDT9001785.1 hypothetical protein [Paucibacter sp. APW11]
MSTVLADGRPSLEGTISYRGSSPALVVLAWAAVGIPLAWGVYRTALSVAAPAGAVTIVVIALIYNNLSRDTAYPPYWT